MNCYVFKGTRKGLMIAIAKVTSGLGAIVAVLWATGDVKAVSGLSTGFIKGTNPAKPDTKMIEEGKKIYFRKCVWCHGVDGAGDGPGADRLWPRPRNFTQAPSRSGIRRAESYRCLIPRSRLLVRMTCLILSPTDCRVRLCLPGMAS